MSVIDWEAKPEPWRSMGLDFCRELGMVATRDPQKPKFSGSAAAIRRLRGRNGWTQDNLAEAAKCVRITIHRLETGQVRNPGARLKVTIAAALGVTVEDIWPSTLE